MTDEEALKYLEPIIASTPMEGYALALRMAYQALSDKILKNKLEREE